MDPGDRICSHRAGAVPPSSEGGTLGPDVLQQGAGSAVSRYGRRDALPQEGLLDGVGIVEGKKGHPLVVHHRTIAIGGGIEGKFRVGAGILYDQEILAACKLARCFRRE